MELLPEINAYLDETKPLGLQDYHVSELGRGEYNINYLIEAPDKKLVLRVGISQLSGAKDQLKQEYEVLDYLKGQGIAPEAYYLDMEGFRYPVLLEEFIEGKPVTELDGATLSNIGRAIGAINNVAITEPHPFEVRRIDYGHDIDIQEQVLNSITATNENEESLTLAKRYVGQARTLLGSLHPAAPTMLIRRDANPTNFILTNDSVKMVDWEITRVDDPTITLASFINEVALYDVLNLQPTERDIEIVKRAFVEVCDIPDFETLLGSRLILEQLGGLVWGLERINNLKHMHIPPVDHKKKMEWYNKVVLKSAAALDESLTA